VIIKIDVVCKCYFLRARSGPLRWRERGLIHHTVAPMTEAIGAVLSSLFSPVSVMPSDSATSGDFLTSSTRTAEV